MLDEELVIALGALATGIGALASGLAKLIEAIKKDHSDKSRKDKSE
ncbi:hypothetical protein [Suicoccus acidiformans]|nr:hypothetical protein [Suicoccus acidiformans]